MRQILITVGLFVALAHAGCTNFHNAERKTNAQRLSNTGEGQTVRWEEQGITFTVPSGWHRNDTRSATEEKSGDFFTASTLNWAGPLKQELDFTIETGKDDFPLSEQSMLEKNYEGDVGANKEFKNLKDLSYLELNGVRGVYALSSYEGGRVGIFWYTFRHLKSKAQEVSVHLSGSTEELESLTMILKSINITRD